MDTTAFKRADQLADRLAAIAKGILADLDAPPAAVLAAWRALYWNDRDSLAEMAYESGLLDDLVDSRDVVK